MKPQIRLALTREQAIFIGDKDEEKGVLKKAFRLIHQVRNQKEINFGLVNPFSPYTERDNDPAEELPLDLFIAFDEPRKVIEQKYVQATSGIILANTIPPGAKKVADNVLDLNKRR